MVIMIPVSFSKTCMNNLFVLTKNNEFLVAAVRMVLFVWDARDGDLIKTLDVHFGRIISLMAVTCRGNKVISASIDKTIKVWNLDKILEDVHHIDRLEKPIDGISVVGDNKVTAESSMVVTPTRSCIGVWNMKTGRLTKRLSNNGSHSIVTHAVVTRDGEYVMSAESGNVVVWDVGSGTVVRTIDKNVEVLQMMLISDDSKVNCFLFET